MIYLPMMALLNTSNDNIDNIHRDLQQSLNGVSDWWYTNVMALDLTKTNCMLIATGQKTPERKNCLNLSLLSTSIEQVSGHRLLEVTVDEQLKWQTHI